MSLRQRLIETRDLMLERLDFTLVGSLLLGHLFLGLAELLDFLVERYDLGRVRLELLPGCREGLRVLG